MEPAVCWSDHLVYDANWRSVVYLDFISSNFGKRILKANIILFP